MLRIGKRRHRIDHLINYLHLSNLQIGRNCDRNRKEYKKKSENILFFYYYYY